jgi:tetratricopeptide (TPR) repeat protein
MLRDNLKFIWLVFSVIFLVIGCTSPQSKIADESGKRDSIKTEVVKSITDSVKLDCTAYKQLAFKSDSILLEALEVNMIQANKAIKDFTNFSYYCHTDSLAPIYLIKTAQLARSINNPKQAEVVLERCINNYPLFKDKPAAMFLLAQLYDEQGELNNEGKAVELYNEILRDFPKSVWAKSAKGALKFIGKSDEEIIRALNKR